MSIQGKAAKSANGASMSKYDVEIEARVNALEAKAHDKCHDKCGGGGGDVAALAARLEEVVAVLKQASPGAAKNL
jgi:hypothetical protein